MEVLDEAVEAEPLKETAKGACPAAAEEETTAVGGVVDAAETVSTKGDE